MESCAETYMEQRAPQLDPAWQISAGRKFLEIKQARKSSEKAHERTNRFKTFVKTFVKSTKVDSVRNFDVERNFGWKDVQSVANEGLEREKEMGNWRRHPTRFLGRTLQNSAPVLQLVLDFIPNNEFTSILCGALALVFSAATRVKNIREKIHACLENLPYVVQRTQKHIDIYTSDPEVWNAAEELYLGILEGVEQMLKWIDESAFATAFHSVFHTQVGSQSVDEQAIKQAIDFRITKFEAAIGDALHNRIANLEKNVEAAEAAISRTLEHLFDFEQQARREQVQSNAQILAAVSSNKAFVTLHQLRDIVGVDSQLVKLDVEVAMLDAEHASQDLSMPESVTSITHHHKFREWLYSNKSEMLLIRWGTHATLEQEAASTLSLLSCLLYRRLSRQGPILPIIHLGRLHNDPNDPFHRPSEMLRYLSTQLLDAEPDRVDLSAFNLEVVQGIQASDMQYLQGLFGTALMAATGRVVVLIVDDLSWMEESPWDHDFGAIVRFWRDLVNYYNRGIPGQTGPVLKILFTNPTMSRYAEEWLPNLSSVLDLVDEGHVN